MTRKRIFERVFDTAGTGALPPRKKAKRESSKAADDSAERAAEEKLMLLGDTRHDRDFQPRSIHLQHCLTIDFPCWLIRKNTRKERQKKKRQNRRMLSARQPICLIWRTSTESPKLLQSIRSKLRHNKSKHDYRNCQMDLRQAQIQFNWLNMLHNRMLWRKSKQLKHKASPHPSFQQLNDVFLSLVWHLKNKYLHRQQELNPNLVSCKDNCNLQLLRLLMLLLPFHLLLKFQCRDYLLPQGMCLVRLDHQGHPSRHRSFLRRSLAHRQ